MSSHLPPCCSSDLSSEHIHTFQVAQKLPQCQSPTALVPVAGRPHRSRRRGAAGRLSGGGDPGAAETPPARLRRSSGSGRFRFCFQRQGRAGERKAKLVASGPQGCPQASAASALPAGQERRASLQQAMRFTWSARRSPGTRGPATWPKEDRRRSRLPPRSCTFLSQAAAAAAPSSPS